MRVELLSGERSILTAMGGCSAATERLVLAVKRRLLLSGVSYEMGKEALAICHVLSSAGGLDHAVGPLEPAEEDEDPIPSWEEEDSEGTTPVEDAILRDAEELPQTEGGRHADSYIGRRMKWEHDFKSTPSTPIHQLEKGRPITYISPNDGNRYGGKFVRINSRDKSMANVVSGEMKKAFPVPIRNITVTDLSPPSPDPLPVQI